MCYTKDKTVDMGCCEHYTESCRKADGGCDRTWEAMDKNPFFVSKTLWSTHNGCVSKSKPYHDLKRNFDKWEFDCSDYKGPLVLYNGEKETIPIAKVDQNKRAMPQAEVVIKDTNE